MSDDTDVLTFEVVVTEMIPVKSTYFIRAENMAEALSIVETIPPKLATKSRTKDTELLPNAPAENRKVLAVSFDHNTHGRDNSRNSSVSHSFHKAVQHELRNHIEARVSDYAASYGVTGISAGSHRVVVYAEMSEDDTALNVTVSLRTLNLGSRFLTPFNRFRPLSPEERSEVRHVRPNDMKEAVPDVVQSFEIFSFADYKAAVENVAKAIVEAKPCAGALDRGAQGQSRVCGKCPYQLACISTKV